MENPTQPPQKPVLVDEPPTFEYVETKRNWIKYLEIGAVVVVISIPLILSFFKIDYSVKRVYEIINPAYIGTSPDNDTWSGIITAAKKIVQPVINVTNNNNTPGMTEEPTSVPTIQPTQQPSQQSSELQNQPQQQQTTHDISYPASEEGPRQPYVPSEQGQTTTSGNEDAPSQAPSKSPSPEQQPQNPPASQIDAYAAYTACYGKKKNAKCSYVSAYGYTVSGVCQPAYGENLLCSAH